ncbi:uncharacterized protein A4U43_C10F5430 [Asparagus officinalis]|uniref:CRIB domain-containing protein n=1 Tax=Asparagus officinalis TaxID=4686 RepID=A0A5P1E407_ASPOF|nr:CRIB domain-containing protein RIC4-like [Asparagus officinalis]ONK56227.1 uncharacterized protein A4U43_C10F5430 [Asparagus officinalis]
MKDRMEKFASFPFSVGCVSHSSVDVVENHPKKSQSESSPTPTSEVQANGRMRSSFLPLPKPNISAGLQKVIKGFKNLSSLFQFYKEDDDDDDEEIEMEIGFPTDVQHVAHIGWDGLNNVNTNMKSWNNFNKGPELLSLPTISLKQFELAMASQANNSPH